ncbi:MBL fold metallo-hydrolase [Nocardia coubleae]|uniref:MBL fold metallo-hydrolase n=1 Tax=Nocardia coubleae TaxID=356147 RepID=A0A846WEQ9_9NOCA|nr:MBL fold metallo-hydrolase [Nocardia coubleae]NKX91156.1 MBL fold metallo-hydrolase [Nocardia coubleae]
MTTEHKLAQVGERVATPDVWQCCRAATTAITGAVLPRRPDRRFLSTLRDNGLPRGSTTVELVALAQNARSVPTAAVVEGVFTPRRIESAMTAFVVRHPRATFLVDPGICVDVRRRAVAELPPILRLAVNPPSDVLDIRESLQRSGIDASDIDFALPTHLHWDHVAGLLDLPDLPLRLHRPEHRWAMTGPVAPVGGVRQAVRDRPLDCYELDGPPVLTFAASHDVFGDGAVVLVDLSGHTPGSIGILLRTVRGPVLLAGDAVWHNLQTTELRQKSGYPGALADDDRTGAWRTIHRLYAVRDAVRIVPSHDHRAACAWTEHSATGLPAQDSPVSAEPLHDREQQRRDRETHH